MIGEIEKNVPIPKNGAGRPVKWPFNKMEIGDSFFCDGDSNYVRKSVFSYASKKNKKFKTRKVDGGTRVWRVA